MSRSNTFGRLKAVRASAVHPSSVVPEVDRTAQSVVPPALSFPPKVLHNILGAILVILLLAGLGSCIGRMGTMTESQMLEVQFTGACEDLLKGSLNFPASYNREWKGWGPEEVEGGLAMEIVFTGTNGFGVPSRFVGLCTLKGETVKASISATL